MCQRTDFQNRVSMDDRRSNGAIVGEHGPVYGESTGSGLRELRIPGQATEEDGEGICIWLLGTLLHLRQASAFDTGKMIDKVGAHLIVQLESVVDPRFTHLVVNEMIPANGTSHLLAGQPDDLQCLLDIIFPQQPDRVLCQLQRILQPAHFELYLLICWGLGGAICRSINAISSNLRNEC